MPYFFDLKCIAKLGGLVPLFEEKKGYPSGSDEIPKSLKKTARAMAHVPRKMGI
ncbi:hypothetical protein D3C85_1635240 [compost metagenome]